MDEQSLRALLDSYKHGGVSEDELLCRLKKLPFDDLGFAKVDHHRELRQGVPEVIFCRGKTPGQVSSIAKALFEGGASLVMATRAEESHFEAMGTVLPGCVYHETAKIVTSGTYRGKTPPGFICVVTAGTADIPVAEEAAVTAETLGNRVRRVYDVGVAGIHRLFENLPMISGASVVVAVAGMEGALPSVLGGLCGRPLIAVPTSVGYGANLGGLSALLSMLNTCAAGVGVVNIDNGFGAGFLASRINELTIDR